MSAAYPNTDLTMPTDQSRALLSLRNITKQYPTVIANDRVNLDVMPSSIHAILGENGAGKSTLMKLAYGLVEPDAGEIYWQGKQVDLPNTAAARKLGIGMVFQHFSLFETLSVVENISLTMRGNRQTLSKQIREIGERYKLDVNPEASVHSLSVGERQRVEIIRCLMQDLKLLILDEPTSVLPPQHINSLFDALRKLRDNHVAILYISHKLEEIRELCDTATILRAGQVTGTVNPNEKTAKELATLMVGHDVPSIQGQHPKKTSETPFLKLSSLSVESHDPFGTSLSNINLDVHGGEIVGIAGVSGNGQQELSRIISGEVINKQLLPNAINIMDQPAGHLNPAARRLLGFSFVPEERLGRGAVPPMPLSKNALLTAFEKGMLNIGFLKNDTINKYTEKCIEEFDVRCAGPSATANSLSGGNLQKYIVGRELMLAPKLLFVAQPTWGVDIGAATAIRQRLLDLRESGVAILIVSEELEELFEITDRLHVINGGTLSPSLKTSELTPNDIGEYMIGNHQSSIERSGVNHAV